MIIDELKNIHLYKNIIPKEIIEDIKGNLNGEPQGEIVKNFIKYKTEYNKPFEQHQKHIDLHIIVKGKEYFGMIESSGFIANQDYNKQHDVSLGESKNNDYLISPFKEKQFVLFFKGEAHKVGWNYQGEPFNVEKIVYKFK